MSFWVDIPYSTPSTLIVNSGKPRFSGFFQVTITEMRQLVFVFGSCFLVFFSILQLCNVLTIHAALPLLSLIIFSLPVLLKTFCSVSVNDKQRQSKD